MAKYEYDEKLVEQVLADLENASSVVNGVASDMMEGFGTIMSARGSEYLSVNTGIATALEGTAISIINEDTSTIMEKSKMIEQYSVDNPSGNIFQKFLSTSGTVVAEAIGSVLKIGESILDTGATILGGAINLFGGSSEGIENFIKKDLVGSGLDYVYSKTNINKYSIWNEKSIRKVTDFTASAAFYTALGAVSGPLGLAAVGVNTFGNTMESSLQNGATFGQAALTASATGAIAVGTTVVAGKLFNSLGKAINSAKPGIGNTVSKVTGKIANSKVGVAVTNGATKLAQSKVGVAVSNVAGKVASTGVAKAISGAATTASSAVVATGGRGIIGAAVTSVADNIFSPKGLSEDASDTSDVPTIDGDVKKRTIIGLEDGDLTPPEGTTTPSGDETTTPSDTTPSDTTTVPPTSSPSGGPSSSGPSSGGPHGGSGDGNSSGNSGDTSQEPKDPTNPSINPTPIPSNPNPGSGNSGGGGFDGDSGFTGEDTPTTEPKDPEDIGNSIIGSTGNPIKIPTSSKPITTTTTTSQKKSSIPVIAGLGAAAIAGIGAKAYLDKREENKSNDEIETEEWSGDEEFDLGYSEEDASEGRDYLAPTDEYAYEDGPEENYQAVNSSELPSMQ